MTSNSDLNAYIAGKYNFTGINVTAKSCIIKNIKKTISNKNKEENNEQKHDITSMEWSDESESNILIGLCNNNDRK